ncbi:uncharacterized protein LOC116351775 [Contarinia nasturtii]|uniref:uncharacterized protein LOC116351775 n=1 Tax=Contarinia nasturtii TaxID=265458 RepID=UPI0012D456F0|nr:uncharacterized protein LOC116351775 [Contarinia nasturtii]
MVQILRVNILLLYIIWIFLVPSHGLKIHPAQEGEGRILRVTTRYFEPFMYRDQFYKGIDFKLIETIAEKEDMELKVYFHDNLITTGFNRLLENKSDILIGGIFPNLTNLHPTTSIISVPYYRDELIWCTQKAKYFPLFISVSQAISPECWLILIFGIGYVTGLILYIFIQFDLKYEKRNQLDWHYTTWLIALPAVIGVNQRFYPKYLPLRIFYGFILIMSLFHWNIVFHYGVRFIREPIQRHQISTVTEIIDEDFRLAGSAEVSNLIAFDDRSI